MEIEPSSSRIPIQGAPVRSARRPEPTASDAAECTTTDSLRSRLERTPDVRPEAVERGRALVNTTTYPPQETMARIARLLAIGLDESDPTVPSKS